MNRVFRRARRFVCVFAIAGPALRAQASRDSLVSRALSEFDANRQVQLLVAALNPSLGPLNDSWSVGVQLLAQTLIDQRRDSTAAVWLRWAIRLSPDLQPDTEQFLPRMTSALRRARDFVDRSKSAGDTAAVTTWVWPSQWTDGDMGSIRFVPTGAALHVAVDGVGLDSSATIRLAPGSHQVSASAAGYDSIIVTREVPSDVTTVLQFRLSRAPAQAAPVPLSSGTTRQPLVVGNGKRFPWIWAALGTAGAGALVVLLTRKNPPPPGSISITVPNPP